MNVCPNVPRKVQTQPTPPKALERNEQNRLLREVERRGKQRDVALVRLLLSCGLRVSEAVLLQVSDLDIGERHGKLTVRQGKGNKWREVPVPPEARRALKEWLDERERRYNACLFLFPIRMVAISPPGAWSKPLKTMAALPAWTYIRTYCAIMVRDIKW
ncbi:MAG: Tyrosine recombinase XerS [Pelotomaculum sp. PtaB.Bin104]|nr:MAG: Tyrosine recombinase XerS [Pelotomaculum sp. PtaB.Bin104]